MRAFGTIRDQLRRFETIRDHSRLFGIDHSVAASSPQLILEQYKRCGWEQTTLKTKIINAWFL